MPVGALLLDQAFGALPRLLGFCDRAKASPTAGCCDRAFWHYRTIDLPNARLQETGLMLALAHSTPGEANFLYGQERALEWAHQIWRFWLACRNSDGSSSEVYPGERSFCATAFAAAAFVEAALLTGGASAWASELVIARPTLAWLSRTANPRVANQMAASALALAGFAKLTGEAADFKSAAARIVDTLALQDVEGAFAEYGDGDVGYQSITIAALARVAALCPVDGLADAVARGRAWAEQRIGERGEVDVASNSRATQFVYPSAFVGGDGRVIRAIGQGLAAGTLLCPGWMDDRYVAPFAIDYLLAARQLAGTP